MEKWLKIIKSQHGHDIGYSLERSPSRIKVLLYFSDQQSKLTLSEASKGMPIDYSNLKGIITGEGGKYKKARSFMSLGLMVCEKGPDNTKLYSLSLKGYDISKILKEEYYSISVDHILACIV